jgi:hypothetical protein
MGDCLALTTKTSQDDVARLVERADIAAVASRLGLQVDGRVRQPRRAICPFHDDKDPSLNLYRGGRSFIAHAERIEGNNTGPNVLCQA